MTTTTTVTINEFDQLYDFEETECPVHKTPVNKVYDFGSYDDAEVYTFKGCKCCVSVTHDPVGTFDSIARYHVNYNNAHGRAKLHAIQAAVKFN